MTANNLERIMLFNDLPDNLPFFQTTMQHGGDEILPIMDRKSASTPATADILRHQDAKLLIDGIAGKYFKHPSCTGRPHEVVSSTDSQGGDGGSPGCQSRPTREGDDNSAKSIGRLMIIEDMPDNLLVLQATMEHEGFEVLPMMDGKSAIERLKQNEGDIDLILSDVMMPGLSGYDLCRCLRSDPTLSHLPIVLITAKRIDEKDELLGINAGADDYLIRPIDPQLLTKKVRLLLDHKQDLKNWQKKYQDKKKEIASTEWGARMLVHDIRNPLTGAKGAIDMLEMDSNVTEDQRFLLNLAQNCLTAQMNMLQDMLTTVAAKNGSLVPNKRSFDLGACMREQVSFQQGAIEVERFNFHCHGPKDVLVTADKKLIERVVSNLIGNALKYGQRCSELEIWCGPKEDCSLPIVGNGRLAFMITNQGPAIPDDIQKKIFQPFTMGETAQQDRDDSSILTAGVGLGLYFCQKVISLHDGFINFISPLPGGEDGVAFYFVLP